MLRDIALELVHQRLGRLGGGVLIPDGAELGEDVHHTPGDILLLVLRPALSLLLILLPFGRLAPGRLGLPGVVVDLPGVERFEIRHTFHPRQFHAFR